MEHLTGTRIRREATPATVNLRRCKLVVIKGAQRGTEFVVSGDVFRVGKAPENDLVLADETVSRVHFEIARDAKGYLVRDLKSTNGTFLDGAEVKEAYLRAGSVIGLGACELKFTPFEERIEILPSEKEQLGEMVGKSPAMREIFGLIERIAPTDATVLIEGETGTGKDMIARTLHLLSPRSAAPFIVVDCGAVAGTLIESELFGHEKGAFTGAVAGRQGAFELASGGTVFLDELGELSLDLQPKLLRVLEQRELRRVGGSKTLKVDLRVIAATRKDLRSEVEKGKFREDLYFRLNVVPITAPALRERREDIPALAFHFVKSFSEELGKNVSEISEGAMDLLTGYDWPGNVRELENALHRATILATDKVLREAHLVGITEAWQDRGQPVPRSGEELKRLKKAARERSVEHIERLFVLDALKRNGGKVAQSARDTAMLRSNFQALMKKHNIHAHEAGATGDDAGPAGPVED
jgi:transcriptional regulator with GAF, ATPase, and Fis domain